MKKDSAVGTPDTHPVGPISDSLFWKVLNVVLLCFKELKLCFTFVCLFLFFWSLSAIFSYTYLQSNIEMYQLRLTQHMIIRGPLKTFYRAVSAAQFHHIRGK